MFAKTAAYGAIHAFLAVALGAFAAHGLKARLDADMLAVFETGVRYQMYHALGLLLTGVLAGLLAERTGSSAGAAKSAPLFVWAGRLLHIGIFLFSGSLYALSLSGISALGIITPFGGLAFLAGWLLIAAALWRSRGQR